VRASRYDARSASWLRGIIRACSVVGTVTAGRHCLDDSTAMK
jgi:hypothetical protein